MHSRFGGITNAHKGYDIGQSDKSRVGTLVQELTHSLQDFRTSSREIGNAAAAAWNFRSRVEAAATSRHHTDSPI
jgi:hypothetical protein